MAKKRPTKRAATKQESPDDLLTTPQAAEIAGVHRVTFSRRLKAGKGPPAQRVGSSGHPIYLVRRGDLLAWLAARDKDGE
jgi:predicted DNA-binding transcriptional regulator AlpA